MIKTVLKRDGSIEPFNPVKLNDMATWAVKDSPVTWSDIAMDALRNLGDVEQVSAKQIQEALVKTCLDKEDYLHNKVAARLFLGNIRKEAVCADNFFDHYYEMVENGLYREMSYTEEEVEVLGKIVDDSHDKDLSYSYPTLRQFYDKYAVKDGKGFLYELPQYMYMGIAMSLFEKDSLEDVIMYYQKASSQKINIPSPILAQQRTKNNTGVSCVITTAGDTLHGIEASKHIAFMATASSAGLGVEYNVRSVDDDVRNGYALAGGKLPHYRTLDKIVKEVKQSCYSDDTEVLTSQGWKLFKDLQESDLVAQVGDLGDLSFVKPLNIFEYDYKGDMYHFTDKGSNRKVVDLLVTPNHKMSWRKNIHIHNDEEEVCGKQFWRLEKSYKINKCFEHDLAENFTPKRCTVFERASLKKDGEKVLSIRDRLRIAFQADGYIHPKSKISVYFRFNKERKLERLIYLAECSGYEYSWTQHKDGTFNLRINVINNSDFDKDFSWVDLESINYEWGLEFLDELRYWDASPQDSSKKSYNYFNTRIEAVNKVSAVCAISGIKHTLGKNTPDIEGHNVVYNIGYCTESRFVSGRGCKKGVVDYEGKVYCVEVPTGNVMVRRNGMSVVCGNSRGGSATVSFRCIDPEIETLLVLKLKRSSEAKRIDQLDYSLLWNDEFLRRAARRQDWALVSLVDMPELWEHFSDDKLFPSLMEKALTDNSIKKKVVNSFDILSQFVDNRLESGRLYRTNLTEVNRHTPFKEEVRLSNL